VLEYTSAEAFAAINSGKLNLKMAVLSGKFKVSKSRGGRHTQGPVVRTGDSPRFVACVGLGACALSSIVCSPPQLASSPRA
jgi:hypothetical protein